MNKLKETKAKLPDRLYYPLNEAADFLGCSVRDLIHMGAVGSLEFSIFIDSWAESEGESFCIFFEGLNTNPEMFMIEDFIGLRGKSWSVTGSYTKDSEINEAFNYVMRNARNIRGFYKIPYHDLIDFEFDYQNEGIIIHTLYAEDDFESLGEVKLHSFSGVTLKAKNLCIMSKDLSNIKENEPKMPELGQFESKESSKTIAKKAELIPQLLKMMSEFNGLDLDTMPVAKIISLVEAVAAVKGIEIPKTDKQTWAKYLGRK